MNLAEMKKRLKKEGFDIDTIDVPFEMSNLITVIRLEAGLTQQRLAELMGTKQESIARAESGRIEPSMSFVYRAATAANLSVKMPRITHNKPN